MTTYDVVIVGSGFGAAVVAARLAEHFATGAAGKRRILVLERGEDHSGVLDTRSDGGERNAQGNRFRNTLDPAYLARIAEVHTDTEGAFRRGTPSMTVVAGKGVGGGSNVYCGVSLRAPTTIFDQVRDGRRLWPAVYSRAALDPYYARVEQELRVQRMRWTGTPRWQLLSKRDYVFAEGCKRIGATAAPLKLACDEDRNAGWWSSGDRFGGRQGLTKNYLAKAVATGLVEIRAQHDVESIVRAAGGWAVEGVERRAGAAVPFAFEAKMLFVGAGAVASTGLLLRSRETIDGLDPGNVLGREVSGNGDYGVTGSVGPDLGLAVEGFKGKPMSSFCPTFWREHQFLIIPFYTEPLYLALGQPSSLLRAEAPAAVGRGATVPREGERDWGLPYAQRLRTFGERMLSMGCLALDEGEGEIVLGAAGNTEVRWRQTSSATERRWSAAVTTMRKIYEALGGEMYLDGYRRDGIVSTAHPLGGCRMADVTATGPARGVVDPNGEVLGQENLFVVDGAVIPSALGTNPSLTIAAVAESIVDRVVRGVGTRSVGARLG